MKMLDVSGIRISVFVRMYLSDDGFYGPEEYFKNTRFDSGIWAENYDDPDEVRTDTHVYTLHELETLAYLVLVKAGEIDAHD